MYSRFSKTGCSGRLRLGPRIRGKTRRSDKGIIEGRLDFFIERLCKTQPSGRTFPLPTSFTNLSQVCPLVPEKVIRVLRMVVVSLNSLNGEGLWNDEMPSAFQRSVLMGLLSDCKRMCDWTDEMPSFNWSDFFRTRGIDYKGEEILSAKAMRWENVESALPDEVGDVALEEVVEKGSRHYVLNFDQYLLAEEDQTYIKPPRVLVPAEHWESFCKSLLDKGVFSRVHESDLCCIDDQPVLNGLFGVSKGEFKEGFEAMRIIMNMVPLNHICRGMDGDVATLPSWSGMSPLTLMPDEDLVVSSEDVRCFDIFRAILVSFGLYRNL